ncbi:MAG TPA: prepilin-type N-terminal cleavage/methylation domain-containing protein [Coriobacteriia bacterium]|nr:prepilin-type N-terminal cleavage/methylation domain-containing protein [Coriobacteriia bacterium]
MRRLREDDGFTLTELIIVMALLLVVMGVVYLSSYAMMQASRVSDRQARFTNEVASPLLAIDKVLVQNASIEAASPYRIVVLTDRNLNNKMERTTIEARADGVLHLRSEELNSQRTAVERVLQDWAVTQHNVNVAQSTPLFRYFDASRGEITAMGAVASDARSVLVTLVAEHDGRMLTDSRSIQFRLRQ